MSQLGWRCGAISYLNKVLLNFTKNEWSKINLSFFTNESIKMPFFFIVQIKNVFSLTVDLVPIITGITCYYMYFTK